MSPVASSLARILSLALASFSLVACGSDDKLTPSASGSQKVTTGDLYPIIQLSSPGDGSSTVEESFRVGGADGTSYLEVGSGETLVATVEGKTGSLNATSDHKYSQSFSYDDPGVTYVVGLLRGELGDAPYTTLSPPPLFSLSPLAATLSRATDSIDVAWSPPASGDVSYTLEGDCIKPLHGSAADVGAFSIAAGTLQPAGAGGSCSVTLTVERIHPGRLDPKFVLGGVAEAHQLRRVEFSSAP